MVLVLDIEVSERALALRKRVLEMGFPCAVSFPPFDIEHLRPIACLLTFQDVAALVRIPTLRDVPMLALGEGFVSKMLHIQVLATEAALLDHMEKQICRFLHGEVFDVFGIHGMFLCHGFVMTDRELHYRLYPLDLSEREKRILMTILTSQGQQNSVKRIEAYCFPYPYHENEQEAANTITTQISSINQHTMQCCNTSFIRYDRKGRGGYVLCVPGMIQETEPDEIPLDLG